MIAEDLVDLVALPPQNSESRVAWRDRPSHLKNSSPIDYVRSTFSQYGKGLTTDDVRRVDEPLYRAVMQFKYRHGWPADFVLPTRKQANDEAIAAAGGKVSFAGSESLTAAQRRNLKRLESAQRRRKR
jgi:hypothetical protein